MSTDIDLRDPNDLRNLRDAFGAYPTGVTVVTTVDAEGGRHGFTANSFTSVSLAPPLLLACPSRRLSSFAAFEHAPHFAVSVLAEGQEAVSNVFAGFKGDRFGQVDWRPDARGAPLIDGAAAQFSCLTSQAIPAGDHLILVGEITGFSHSKARGLGYAGGAYFSLGLERAAAASASANRTIAGAIVEKDGCVLTLRGDDGATLPTTTLTGFAHARSALTDALAERGILVDLGRTYSIFEDRSVGAQSIYFRAGLKSDAPPPAMGEWTPISALPALDCASAPVRAMLTRYAFEHATRDFRLYVGDETGGDVQPLD